MAVMKFKELKLSKKIISQWMNCLNIHLHFLGFVTIDWLGWLGSPGPASLTARTRNSYSTPSSKLSAVPLQYGLFNSAAFVQLGLPFSLFSMMYPITGEPPSFLGGVHFKSTWSLSQSVISGVPGASGLSVIEKIHYKPFR